MSHMQYFSYKGFGEEKREQFWYNQAVRIGDRIECSGQGGWDPATSVIHTKISDEIDQAFSNVDLALRTAGGKGWSQVYKVRMYVLDVSDAVLESVVANMKKWMPDHQPLLTFLGVRELGIKGMHIEIEVEAHVGEQ